jgi:hypothetical protein
MPNNPPPDPPIPPNGPYTSTCGADFSSWDGSFTYDNTTKAIVYTRTNPSQTYSTTNGDNGNAIHFDLTDTSVTPNQTVQFKSSTFKYKEPGNKAEYKGTCKDIKDPVDGLDDWTASQ